MSTNSIVVATVTSESLAAKEETSRKAGIAQLGGICLWIKYYGAEQPLEVVAYSASRVCSETRAIA